VKAGDRVTWRHESRGGYGFTFSVAAVVVRVSRVRATIRVAVCRRGVWELVEKRVRLSSLEPRVHKVAQVDEP